MRWLWLTWGHGVNSGSISVEKGVSLWRQLTEFDKAVSAERPQGHSLAPFRKTRHCMCSSNNKAYRINMLVENSLCCSCLERVQTDDKMKHGFDFKVSLSDIYDHLNGRFNIEGFNC